MTEHFFAVMFGALKRWAFLPLLAGAVGLAMWGANWWAGIVQKDATIRARDGTITELAEKLTTARNERDQQRTELEAEVARVALERDVQRREALAASARAQRFQNMYAEIRNAPEADNGPVAPVLQRAFGRVRDELRGTLPPDA